MRFEFKDSVISEIHSKELGLIKPFGLETADSSSFYSLEDGVGYRYKNFIEKDTLRAGYRNRVEKVIARDGEWKIELNESSLGENELARQASLTALSPSYLMDFVIRYRFAKEKFQSAKIADLEIQHESSNIYYQYDVNEVTLKGRSCTAKIFLEDYRCPKGFKPTMYVRDSKDDWVVHVRLFPDSWDKEIIKVCNYWSGTRALPDFITRFLMKSDVFRCLTWYRGEKMPYKSRLLRRFFNLVSFGLVKLNQNEIVELKTKLLIE